MKRLLTAIVPLAVAAALVSGCGGSGGTKPAQLLPPTSTAKKPNGSAVFTLRFPTNLVRAHASDRRAPRFLDPYGSPIIKIDSTDLIDGYYSVASAEYCTAVSPGSDGTQQVTVPVFSDGGAIAVYEYQTGTINADGTCSGSGVLATTWNPSPGYYLSNVQIPYTGFTPGTDVYAFAPTPTPSPNPSASPTATPTPNPSATPTPFAGPLFSVPLTLQPSVYEIIWSSQYYAANGYAPLPSGAATLSSGINTCLGDVLTFLAADANGVSDRAVASSAPSPAPSASASFYSGFLPVTLSQFDTRSGFSGAGAGSTPGTVNVPAGAGSLSFTVTAYDVFGHSVTSQVTITGAAC